MRGGKLNNRRSKMSETEIEEKMGKKPIRDKILDVFKNRVGKEFKTQQIKDLVVSKYPDTNKASVIPSDYCYNITNKGINFCKQLHLFKHIKRNHYKVLGEDYNYNGPTFAKDGLFGEWKNGVFKCKNK